jgi:hypothetical protein
MTPPPAPPGSVSALQPAIGRLLRPLVRLLIGRGMTFPMVAEILRESYVNVARDVVAARRQKPTDSRLSLLTGIHRKEIRRQRLHPAAAPAATEGISVGRLIVARWLAAPPWCDAGGRPLPLPRRAARSGLSFDALVAAVTTDVRPRAVLDALLTQGVVRLDADKRVVLNAAAYLPETDTAARLDAFAQGLHDHIAAAVANLAADGEPPFLDRCLRYEALTPEQSSRLAALARLAAERLLSGVARAARAKRDAPSPPAPDTPPARRASLGIYFYAEEEER